MIRVETVAASGVDDELTEAVARLLPQLSSSAAAPARADLEEIAASEGSVLFVARAADEPGEPIVGMLTLVTYRIPTGRNAVIEDVVVDEKARRSGAASELVQAALDEAGRRGVRHVDLTSRASREAANRLYVKMGFQVRETNVYRHAP